MTPQELKNSILQLAIQGKLVEQRPEEGTGEELYREIQREKAALIKEGKIKKEKPLPEITEDEIPFEIPESWKWCHPQDLASIVVGATPSTSNPLFWSQGTIAWLPSGCCQDCEVLPDDSTVKLISQAAFDSCSTKMMPPDTIMIALTGATAGKVGLLRFEACGNQSIVGISLFPFVLPEFMFYQLMARRREILSDCVGSAQPHISKEYVIKMCFLLPPLAEQKRIVAKIEKLLPNIDRYAGAWNRLEDFNKRFPEDLRKSILQLAIQGKLVEQRPEEGTGEELYREIQREKAALIKAGKIKKEKPLPEIKEDEVPFEIPEGWKWVRLATVTDMLSGFAFKSEDFKAEGKYRLLRGINLGVNDVRWKETVYVDTISNRVLDYRLAPGDVVLGLDRPWISDGTRVAIYDEEKETYLVQRVLRIRGLFEVTSPFIVLLLQSSLLKDPLSGETTGISVPHISPNQVGNIVIPLPPLAEQKRIVEKVEELLAVCEGLR